LAAPHNRTMVAAIAHIDLTVEDREFVCVLGPSGCGKTTLLRLIAGLLTPDDGEIRIDGRLVDGPGPDRGVVFQDFALLPWANVLRNVGFGLELRGVSREEREVRARALIETVGLTEFTNHRPSQLSGGMQQRVGLARALAVDPSILLMDEPFGALDAQTRRGLQIDLLKLHQRHRKTVVFVTHSVDEAVRLGDRIVLLTPRPGRVSEIVDVGLPRPRPADLASMSRFIEIKEYLWARLTGPEDLQGAVLGD
jgi:NitT/TauT family transport system ATP-binding protein